MDNRAFSRLHPTVQFVFFTVVMLFTMFVSHPVFLAVSLLCSSAYAVRTGGVRTVRSLFLFIIPTWLLISIINPLFDHAGVTILFYLPDGNPFTLESVIYGIVSGCILSSVMLWCISLRHTMTSDRVIYLFGRAAPKLGLLLSMIMRFIPQFVSQFRRVRAAQRCIGSDIGQGNILRRTANLARIISSVIGWAMEHSLITADSMKSRAYGTGRRSSFTLFRFELRDTISLLIILPLSGAVLAGCVSGTGEFYYFPAVSQAGAGLTDVLTYLSFALLCSFPILTDIKEVAKWNAIRSVR